MGKRASRNRSVAIIGTRGYPSFYGGFETAVRHLAPYLADQGWDVTVYGRPGSTVDDEMSFDGRITTRITRGLETKSLSTLSYGLTSTLDAARRGTDVALVMNCANGFWLPILRHRKIPTLVNVDGIEWERDKWGRVARFVFKTGARLTARYGDRLVFDSQEIGAHWRSGFARDGDFIPYGGDDPGALPVETGLEHRKYVLMVARFVAENSVPEFVEAARLLARDTKVVIVGSSGYGGELDSEVRRLAESSEHVRWLGHMKNDRRLHALWQHAGVYFHGHSVGGTNPALVQAMACGAPTLARDTVFNRETLGNAGKFVEARPADIVAEIRKVLSDAGIQERMSEAARSRATAHYSWSSVCAAYDASLHSVLDAATQFRDANPARIAP